MHNRTEFLAAGLVPVTNTSELPSDGCSICTDPFENPVALPCKHIFCKQCVADWLSLPNRNSCPFCRHECFPITYNGPTGPVTIPRAPMDRARTAIISQALARSGLMNGEFDIFSDDISWDTPSLQRATASANQWLHDQTDVPIGPSLINKRRLGHDILAMGNLLRGYARASGRPYTARQIGEWRIVVDLLYKRVEARHGETENAMILSYQLNSDVRLGLLQALGAGRWSTFVEPQGVETPCGDVHRLIHYVACRAAAEDALRRQRRQDIRDEPNPLARMGMRVHNVFRG